MAKTGSDARILQLIKQDHDTVQELFQQFQRAYEQDRGKARSISRQIINELKLHTELEEQLVYPRLREQDEALYHEAEEEHHVAELLERL